MGIPALDNEQGRPLHYYVRVQLIELGRAQRPGVGSKGGYLQRGEVRAWSPAQASAFAALVNIGWAEKSRNDENGRPIYVATERGQPYVDAMKVLVTMEDADDCA